jgi:hypothetical protein
LHGIFLPEPLEGLAAMNIAKDITNILFVGVVHFVIGVCLYYLRITHQSAFFDSDVLVFLVPTGLALAGYFLVTLFYMFPKRHWKEKIAPSMLIAFMSTAISTTCVMIFAFNTWGK